jgi:hypothetical protein
MDDAAPAVYNPVFYNGTLPGPDTDVARQLNQKEIAQHKQDAIDFYQFLVTPNKNLLQLNEGNTSRVAIIGLPNSKNVRIVHCIGVGSSTIGQVSQLDGQILCLCGDGGRDIGAPTPLILPPDIVTATEMICMTREQFETNLTTAQANFTWPLTPRLRAFNANNTVTIMKIAPIPATLVFDGIDKDLNAAEVIERIDSLDDNDGEMFTHARNFLMACLTSHNIADENPRIESNTLLAPAPGIARRWATSKFTTTYPALANNPQNAPQGNNGEAPAMPQAGLGNIDPTVAAILAQLTANQTRAIRGEEKKDDDADLPLNMSPQELEQTVSMCGLPAGAHHSLLPPWYRQCAEKGMTDTFRYTIVRKQIMTNTRYEDADVALTNTILKMAVKRKWLGGESNVECPSYSNATDGLSPFILLDLNEDEVADLNADDEAVALASSVTPNELKALKLRQKAIVPSSSEKFLLLLMSYANLLYALFGADCPLFLCVVRLVTAYKAFSRSAREKMSTLTRGSILWVLLKQSRQFAIGEMDILQEFKGMHEMLANKMLGFTHAETPNELITNSTPTPPGSKRKPTDPPLSKNKPTDIKKPRLNPNTWHAKLKSTLEPAMQASGNPGFLQIMKYCEQDLNEVYKLFGDKCAPNVCFGQCSRGKECPRQHTLPNDAQVAKVLEITKKFLDNPTGILRG